MSEADDSIFGFECVDEGEGGGIAGGGAGGGAVPAASTASAMAMLIAMSDKLKDGTATVAERDEIKRMASAIEKEKLKKDEARGTATKLHAARKRELTHLVMDRRIGEIVQVIAASEEVELTFLIDCTSSMHPHIAAVKNQIRGIVEDVKRSNSNLKLRLSMVGYRDLHDTRRYEVLPFTPSTDTFIAFMARLNAEGGADACEDMAVGLQQANGLTWQAPTRVLILIADAPCHGSSFHDLPGSDDYTSGTPGIDILSELKQLVAKNVAITFIRITRHTDKMIQQFSRHIAPATISQVSVGKAETGLITSVVKMSVRAAIHETLSAGLSAHTRKTGCVTFAPVLSSLLEASGSRGSTAVSVAASLKEYTMDPAKPDFSKQTWLKQSVERHVPPASVSDLRKTSLRFGRESTSSSTMVKVAANPFAQGACRLAYHGLVKDTAGMEHAFVFKEFKVEGEGVHDHVQYKGQIEVSTIARYLAQLYNSNYKGVGRQEGMLPIEYLDAFMVSLPRAGGQQYHCMEPALPPGTFTKWSNNTGYFNTEACAAVSADECKTLAQFTRFTYKVTEGYLMIVDLQGVLAVPGGGKQRRFVLTDPVIFCTDLSRFGNTNLGSKAMFKRCLDSAKIALG
jgi:hypothetical protein